MRSVLLLVLLSAAAFDSSGQIALTDRFGRDLQARAVQLVDWEGFIANPAVELHLSIPEAWKPATVVITTPNPRLHFADRRFPRSEPTTVTSSGATLTLLVDQSIAPTPFFLAIWPDRDTKDEAYSILISVYTASSGVKTMRLPVLVDDQDVERDLDFHVTLDTQYDQTAFYTNPNVLGMTRRAADDWAYFLSDNDVDEIRQGASRTWIWNPDGFMSGYWVTNSESYTGFLLYAWGMRNNLSLHSGGAASGQYQTNGGWPNDLMSAGHIAMDLRGNYNLLGWSFYNSEDDWWRSANQGREINDFYSLVHHHIGHAMFFSDGHLKWKTMKSQGGSTSSSMIAYLKGPAVIDRFDHIFDRGNNKYIVDPASRRGAFGSEYAEGEGVMSPKRWIITKTDLLMAREVGYELRETSAFRPMTIASSVPAGNRGVSYYTELVSGGVPHLFVEVVSGALPAGLRLDSFSGRITGTSTESGSFPVGIRATDETGVVAEGTVTFEMGLALSTEVEGELPPSGLLEVHPNPVAGSAVLAFETDAPGPARLEVYDLLGRQVSTVWSGTLTPGRHEFAWDSGSLPAGAYVAHLSGPSGVASRMMTVVR